MFKAVVDANVLISGFISPYSHPREIEKRWREEEFILVTSPDIVSEVRVFEGKLCLEHEENY